MKNIELKLLLNDKLTASLKSTVTKAASELNNLQKKLDGLKSPSLSVGMSGGLGMKELVGANLLSSAITSVASSVLSAGQTLASSISSAFTQAANASRGQLGSTGAISSLLDVSFDQASKIQANVTKELAESAKRLPGSTANYLDAFNGISDSLSISGGLTQKGLNSAGKDIVELTALLGQQSGAGSAATSTALGKMLGETGSEALFRIDVFEKVPAFKVNLEKGLSKAGKTLDDFFKMDAKQKQEYLVLAKQSLYSKDFLKAMNETADGQLDTMMSELFDPNSGLFGFLRGIKVDGVDTTVFAEIGKLFTTFKPLAASIQRVLSLMGVNLQDPMVSLSNTIQSIGNLFRGITSTLNSINPGQFNLGDLANRAASGLSSMIGSAMSQLAGMMSGVNWSEAGYQVTNGLLQGVRWLMDSTTSYLQNNSDELMMIAFASLRAIVTGFAGVMVAVRDNALPLIGSVATLAIQALATGVGSALGGLAGIVVGAVQGIGYSFTTAFNNIKNAIQSSLSSVVSQAQSFLSNLVTGGNNQSVGSRYNGQNLGLINAYNGLNLGAAINREMINAPQGSKPVIANSSEVIIPRSKLGMLNNQINITVNAQLDRVISEVTEALTVSLKPLSMVEA